MCIKVEQGWISTTNSGSNGLKAKHADSALNVMLPLVLNSCNVHYKTFAAKVFLIHFTDFWIEPLSTILHRFSFITVFIIKGC